jgi:hypothetical protein
MPAVRTIDATRGDPGDEGRVMKHADIQLAVRECQHREPVMDETEAPKCKVCGGPISRHNKYGICQRTPACKDAYRTAWSRVPENREREYERARTRRRALGRTPEERNRALTYYRKRRAFWTGIVRHWKAVHGCAMCGFANPDPDYYDLDHLDPSAKDTEIARLCAALNPSNPEHLQQFQDEMRKCQVLCVACHRKRTREQLYSNENIDTENENEITNSGDEYSLVREFFVP